MEELCLHFSSPCQTAGIPAQEILAHLPRRRTLHHKYSANPVKIVTNVDGRAAGFGISALTVFNQNDKYVAVIGRRSSAVGTYADTYHVIPAGMTNVDIANPSIKSCLLRDGLLNVRHLIEKEFLEEIFSAHWASSYRRAAPADWSTLIQENAAEHMYGKHNEYGTTIYLTGIAIDLQYYRPEVCALILIRNRKWFDQHSPHRSEGATATQWKLSYEWMQDVEMADIGDDEQLRILRNTMKPQHSVLSGIAALYMGVNKTRTVL